MVLTDEAISLTNCPFDILAAALLVRDIMQTFVLVRKWVITDFSQ